MCPMGGPGFSTVRLLIRTEGIYLNNGTHSSVKNSPTAIRLQPPYPILATHLIQTCEIQTFTNSNKTARFFEKSKHP